MSKVENIIPVAEQWATRFNIEINTAAQTFRITRHVFAARNDVSFGRIFEAGFGKRYHIGALVISMTFGAILFSLGDDPLTETISLLSIGGLAGLVYSSLYDSMGLVVAEKKRRRARDLLYQRCTDPMLCIDLSTDDLQSLDHLAVADIMHMFDCVAVSYDEKLNFCILFNDTEDRAMAYLLL